MTYILFRLPIPLNRRLVHIQDVPLNQQERPNFDIVGRRELKVRIRNRKVRRNGDVWSLNRSEQLPQQRGGSHMSVKTERAKGQRVNALSRAPAGNALG
jgi:hypothetical protein